MDTKPSTDCVYLISKDTLSVGGRVEFRGFNMVPSIVRPHSFIDGSTIVLCWTCSLSRIQSRITQNVETWEQQGHPRA